MWVGFHVYVLLSLVFSLYSIACSFDAFNWGLAGDLLGLVVDLL